VFRAAAQNFWQDALYGSGSKKVSQNMSLCTDYSGFGHSVTDWICNASSGNLSQAQVNAAKAEVARQVEIAAAGRPPQTVANLVAQAQAEIDMALRSFQLPGEKGQDIGASPAQAGVRIPGTGTLTLSKLSNIVPTLPDLTTLKWYALAGVVIVGTFFAFPYIAPGLVRNLRAARSLRA
jgi:hypothetical protein